ELARRIPSGTRPLARAMVRNCAPENPYAVTVVILRTGQRLSLKQRWPVVMDSGPVASGRQLPTEGAPRNDEPPRSRGAIPPEVCKFLVLTLQTEGAGKAGCRLHPRSRVPKRTVIGAHEHTG